MTILTPVQIGKSSWQAQRYSSDLLELFIVENYLEPEFCQAIMAVMQRHSVPSNLTIPSPDPDFRTSYSSYLAQLADPVVIQLEEKISRTLGIDLSYSEPIQAQYYQPGGQFKLHTDYFLPNTPEYQKFAGMQGNRTWTVMIYLNTVPKGGGTFFQSINTTTPAIEGTALVWNNLYPDQTVNPHTQHAGLVVEAGYKAIVTKWFRQKRIF